MSLVGTIIYGGDWKIFARIIRETKANVWVKNCKLITEIIQNDGIQFVEKILEVTDELEDEVYRFRKKYNNNGELYFTAKIGYREHYLHVWDGSLEKQKGIRVQYW